MMTKRIYMSGGLGNQMFQYAFYLSMRIKGINCVLDDSEFFLAEMHNGLELNRVFNIADRLSKPSVIRQLLTRIVLHYSPKSFLYRDRAYEYCEDVYSTKLNLLKGDWLSPKYFEFIKQQIVETYRFQNISTENLSVASIMKNENSVSIHIRRGDYLKLPYYCVCDEDYYANAINLIKNTVDIPVFYIFSNEPSWCESFMMRFAINFKIIDWNQGADSYQDMYLMTQCKHNIIANSTFSWWGAWLNQHHEKIVIAPSKWFKNSDHNINLPEWQLIDTSNRYDK